MKSFYEFVMEQGWVKFVLMFIAIASIIEIAYVFATGAIADSLINYALVVVMIWLSYMVLLGSAYDRERQKEFHRKLKMIFDEMETSKEYPYYFAPPDGLYIMTERGEYYLKICEVKEADADGAV